MRFIWRSFFVLWFGCAAITALAMPMHVLGPGASVEGGLGSVFRLILFVALAVDAHRRSEIRA